MPNPEEEKRKQEKQLLLNMVLTNKAINKDKNTKEKVNNFNKTQLMTLACILRGLERNARDEQHAEKLLADALKERPKEEKHAPELLDEKEKDLSGDPTTRLVNFLYAAQPQGSGAANQGLNLNKQLRDLEAAGMRAVRDDLRKAFGGHQPLLQTQQAALQQPQQAQASRVGVTPRLTPGGGGQSSPKDDNWPPRPDNTTLKRRE